MTCPELDASTYVCICFLSFQMTRKCLRSVHLRDMTSSERVVAQSDIQSRSRLSLWSGAKPTINVFLTDLRIDNAVGCPRACHARARVWCCYFLGIAHRPCRGVVVLQMISTNTSAYRSTLPFGDTVSMQQLHLCFRSTSTRHLILQENRILHYPNIHN